MTHRMLRTALVGLIIIVAAPQAVFPQEANQAYQQYELRKVDPWGPFVLNLLLPFGIGSFVQGDTTGGCLSPGGR